jgi:ribosomal protein L36
MVHVKNKGAKRKRRLYVLCERLSKYKYLECNLCAATNIGNATCVSEMYLKCDLRAVL